jgi:hypothetical protein
MALPYRAEIKAIQRRRARGHVGKTAQPDETVRAVQVAELADDPHAVSLLALDEMAVEDVDQHVPFAWMQRVLTQFEHCVRSIHGVSGARLSLGYQGDEACD